MKRTLLVLLSALLAVSVVVPVSAHDDHPIDDTPPPFAVLLEDWMAYSDDNIVPRFDPLTDKVVSTTVTVIEPDTLEHELFHIEQSILVETLDPRMRYGSWGTEYDMLFDAGLFMNGCHGTQVYCRYECVGPDPASCMWMRLCQFHYSHCC